MKRVCLFDDYDARFDYKNGGEFISLDPATSYHFEKNGIIYKIPEDYYKEAKLRCEQENYFHEQLEWFDNFDRFLHDNIRHIQEYKIPLARLNYLRIKYLVDTTIIYSYIVKRILEDLKDGDKVVHTHKQYPASHADSIFHLKVNNRKVFSDLLKLFCINRGIDFIDNVIPAHKLPKKERNIPSLSKAIFPRHIAKSVHNILKYRKYRKKSKSEIFIQNMNVFVMHAGSPDIDIPIRELIGSSVSVFSEEKGKAIREDSIRRKKIDIPELGAEYYKDIDLDCSKCSEKIEDDPKITKWINNKCYQDVSAIVVPFLKHFISEDCRYILKDALKKSLFFEENNINLIIARGNSDKDSLGAFVGAKYVKNIKCICVQHSSFAVDMELFSIFETQTYDHILTRDEISQEYFTGKLENMVNTFCSPIQSGHYLGALSKKSSAARRNKEKEKVAYVEKRFPDRVRCFNNMIYPITWYYEFQKQIVDFLSKRDDFEFIYKTSGQNWSKKSTLHYIEDKGYENVSIFHKHFLKTLNNVDRIIVDYPSCALFEAAASGKPVLCLYADYLKVLPRAKEIFGRCLKPFSSDKEAIGHIEDFLNSDPSKFIIKVPFSDRCFIDVFTALAGSKNG